MTIDDLKTIAKMLNEDLHSRTLTSRNLYVCACFYAASPSNPQRYPDRIVVEGIKCMRSTGRFNPEDRVMIDHVISRYCYNSEMNINTITWDPCMHNAVITIK